MRVPTVPRRRRGFRVRGWIIAGVILLVILLLSLRGLAGFYTDFLWFDSVGQGGTWRELLSARVVPALVFTLVFFVIMQQRRTFRFKAQHRWLQQHPDLRQHIGLQEVPNRTTLSRRYKDLYPVLQDFIAFLGQYAEDLAPQFTSQDLYTDKSLFKAQGPVWHQSDRQAGRIPDKLRHLTPDLR